MMREAGLEQMVRRAVAGWRTEKVQGIYATVVSKDRQAAARAMGNLVITRVKKTFTHDP